MPVAMPGPWFLAHTNGRRIAGGLDDEPMRPLRDGERRLAGFILPPFQRPPVWSVRQKIALIESLWDGLPIGAYVVNRLTMHDRSVDCADWLLDGQQRWTAITDYVNGLFPVYGAFFPEIGRQDQSRFRGIPIAEVETKITTREQCEKVYYRLAYGGTAHDPMPEEPASGMPAPR